MKSDIVSFQNELAKWLQKPQSIILLEKEKHFVASFSSAIFGSHAVQLGFPFVDFLSGFRIQKKITAGLAYFDKTPDILCEIAALPIASESMDLVILPHVLEFSGNPHAILREVERILIPEGHLLLTGFHKYSLGVLRKFLDKKNEFPWFGQFVSASRLKDWLMLLNFEVKTQRLTPFYTFLEPSVYTLHAIKRRCAMRLIVPNFPIFSQTAPVVPAKTCGVLQCPPKTKP